MNSGSCRESGTRMSRKTAMLVVVLVVALLALASLSAFFYWQAHDYRDAKYRSQAVLVSSCLGAVYGVVQGIPGMYDDSLPITNRSWFAEHTVECLWDMVEGSMAIGYMYPTGSIQNETLTALKTAAELMTIALKGVSRDMWANVTLSSPYFENGTMKTNALLTVSHFEEIGRLLYNATDPLRDWAKSPYSLVDRMDLDAIKLSSEHITQLAIPLQPHR